MQAGRRLVWGGVLAGGLYWLVRYLRPRHSSLVLNDKVVIITGASTGIGRALAFAFARRGARVVLAARSVDRLEAVRREIEPYTAAALVVPTDVTDQAQLQHLVDETLARFGRIDVLVNNAGRTYGGWLHEQPPELIEQLLDVNLRAPLHLTRLVLPHLLAQHSGYILNVASGLSRSAGPLFAAYTATKFGVAGFSDALRRELAGTGVYLTLVLPGWTDTDMVPAEAQEIIERHGFEIESADDVAERAVLGLVRGENEVILGGTMARLGILAERFAPVIVRWYWRLWLTPEWVAAMEKVRSG